MTNSEGPKPGPHLYQPPTLAELAELHARAAHDRLAQLDTTGQTFGRTELLLHAAEAHAAVARACAHAAIASRPQVHYRNGAGR